MSAPLNIKIFVISLQRSLDRRKQVEKEMQKISLPWEFLDAIDGSALTSNPVEYKPTKVKRLQGYELTPNEIGCYLSHKEAWKRCVSENAPTLVLEDDFALAPNFENVLSTILEADDSWNFLRLQGLYEVPYKTLFEKSGVAFVRNEGDAVGATAYLLKPEIAKQLIQNSADIYEPVDHFLEHHQKHGLEFLAIRPYPVDITRAKSTIADRSERSPVQGLQKRWRSVARVLDRALSKDPWFPK
ncbi:glycosyltransferase family 25 protein [Polynucleobacter sp. UK-Gri1-W3]|uniref:glycosyltransferase family 25 protein n=1 Tax=Polynucleobacter sp. UK-Gri1-W3 TaxID=1819737 RepID=UPI001C0CB758|nr:glycosyltransferase family 25 protein [Polynucleobacter sp. UK-Gri1-W3]MBU3538169.1 glycosyltransferase family 25 protein [Polynucleobacter sp. UK-Gri1-W3]